MGGLWRAPPKRPHYAPSVKQNAATERSTLGPCRPTPPLRASRRNLIVVNSDRMEFAFNERKTAEAAAHLLKLAGGSMDLLVLLKLLYLADRRTLIERGMPITGDRMVAMKKGPVLARVYDATKGKYVAMPSWTQFVSHPNEGDPSKRVRLLDEPPAEGRLSDYEITVLREIHGQYGHENKWDLSELTHKLPEYHDPGDSRLPIDPRTILEAAGKTKEEIAWSDELARTSRAIARYRNP